MLAAPMSFPEVVARLFDTEPEGGGRRPAGAPPTCSR